MLTYLRTPEPWSLDRWAQTLNVGVFLDCESAASFQNSLGLMRSLMIGAESFPTNRILLTEWIWSNKKAMCSNPFRWTVIVIGAIDLWSLTFSEIQVWRFKSSQIFQTKSYNEIH